MSSGFVAGTLVHTDKGLVPIQNLKIGDLVLTMSENNIPNEDGSCNTTYKPIANIYKSEKPQSIHAMLCTDEQPFWIKSHGWIISSQVSDWMKAYSLEIGYFKPNNFNYYDNHSENKSFLLETPFDKVAVAFKTIYDTRNESWWDNEPYVVDFNKESIDGNFPLESHPKSRDDKDWWVTQGFEITEADKEKYLKAIKFVIEEDRGNLTPYWDDFYNIEVTNCHTYFISKLGILVGDITVIGKGLDQDTLYDYKTWKGI